MVPREPWAHLLIWHRNRHKGSRSTSVPTSTHWDSCCSRYSQPQPPSLPTPQSKWPSKKFERRRRTRAILKRRFRYTSNEPYFDVWRKTPQNAFNRLRSFRQPCSMSLRRLKKPSRRGETTSGPARLLASHHGHWLHLGWRCSSVFSSRAPSGSIARWKPNRESSRQSPLYRLCPLRSLRPSAWHSRKSTRLNSSHLVISYAVFCLKKKKKRAQTISGHRVST